MDQKALFQLANDALGSLRPLRENTRSRAALESILGLLTTQNEPYTYNAIFTTATNNAVPIGGQATFSIRINAQRPFKFMAGCMKLASGLNWNTLEADATRRISPITVLLTDSGSGRQMMDTPVPIDSLFGTGQEPFYWPEPKIMYANSVLQVQVTNLDTVNTFQLILSFIGAEMYRLG